MSSQKNPLDHMRIASPCPVSWESMKGDELARFCDQCHLHVYNISEMTRPQAESLIARTEGRICARLYRRADGTVLTKDCPVGLRALRRRISRVAGAAFTALLSLSASALGQTLTRTTRMDAGGPLVAMTHTFSGLNPQEGRATFWGIITDPNGAVIPGAQATIINEKTKYKRTIKSDNKGQFKFGLLEPGLYTFKFEYPGFRAYQREHLRLHSNEDLRLDVVLDIGFVGEVVYDELPGKGINIDGVHVKINEE